MRRYRRISFRNPLTASRSHWISDLNAHDKALITISSRSATTRRQTSSVLATSPRPPLARTLSATVETTAARRGATDLVTEANDESLASQDGLRATLGLPRSRQTHPPFPSRQGRAQDDEQLWMSRRWPLWDGTRSAHMPSAVPTDLCSARRLQLQRQSRAVVISTHGTIRVAIVASWRGRAVVRSAIALG